MAFRRSHGLPQAILTKAPVMPPPSARNCMDRVPEQVVGWDGDALDGLFQAQMLIIKWESWHPGDHTDFRKRFSQKPRR